MAAQGCASVPRTEGEGSCVESWLGEVPTRGTEASTVLLARTISLLIKLRLSNTVPTTQATFIQEDRGSLFAVTINA